MEHDEYSEAELAELQRILQGKIASCRLILQTDANQTVELDQSKMGRLSRIDAMQQQEMMKKAVTTAEQQLVLYQNIHKRLVEETDEFGYCIRCGEAIPFKRLCFRPESQICVPCLS